MRSEMNRLFGEEWTWISTENGEENAARDADWTDFRVNQEEARPKGERENWMMETSSWPSRASWLLSSAIRANKKMMIVCSVCPYEQLTSLVSYGPVGDSSLIWMLLNNIHFFTLCGSCLKECIICTRHGEDGWISLAVWWSSSSSSSWRSRNQRSSED